MANVTRFFTFFVAILIALHIWAAISPSHYNWGLHYFAFYPLWWSVPALLAGVLVLVPVVRSALLGRLSAVVRGVGQLPPAALILAILGFWVGLMFLFPAKLHLLGDSELILQLTPKLPSIEDVSANFRNQPLTYQALRLVQWASGGGGAVEPMNLYRIADGVAGIAYLWLIIHLLRTLPMSALDATLLGILLLFRAGVQFFFGYVENYMFFYVALSAYVVTGWLALEEKGPRWLPLALLASVPGFHIAGVIFLPTAILLLGPWWKEHRKMLLAALAAIAAAGIGGVILLDPSWVLTRIADAARNDLLPLTTPPGGIPYGLFSFAHIADWANANAHIAPFSLACVAIGMIVLPRKEYAGGPVFRFLTGASIVGLATSFLILPALGMARDWDMLSNFFIPVRFLSIYFLIILLRAKEVRAGVLMLAVVGLVRWFGWIGINADEDRHLARAEILSVPELSGTFPKIYYENLGKTFIDRKDYARAAKWYERYMSVDSTHPRILANLSDCYRALGDKENLFRMLRLSVEAKSTNAGVYSNLAIEYISRGDTSRGMALLREGLQFNPGHFESLANLTILSLERGDYQSARRYAVDALRLGMRDPVLFKNAGYASYFLSDFPNAVLYLNEYLKAAPADAGAKKLFDALERQLGAASPLRNKDAGGRPDAEGVRP